MNRMYLQAGVLCAAIGFNAFTVQAQTQPVARWDHVKAAKLWTQYALDAIAAHGAALVTATPKDIAQYCPGYANADATRRAQFWMGLLSALTRHESAFKPETSFKESFNDSKGQPVISRGLLQLSIESANGYGCNITDAKLLHDARVNLTCGVRILTRWVANDGVVAGGKPKAWRGAARYWSPFRKADKIKDMSAWTRQQAYCRL